MAYSFQKVYTLIAQTPMIHFQHDQKGATLRATEVKPKLDRYLLKCAEAEKTPIAKIVMQNCPERDLMKKEIYSYHTFMFPFLYATDKMTRKEFGSRCHPGWHLDLWEPERMNNQIDYNQYHYFNETAHNTIYTTKSVGNGKKSKSDENFENTAVINLRFDLSSLSIADAADIVTFPINAKNNDLQRGFQ